MRAMRYGRHGDADVQSLEEVADPEPGHGGAVVDVHAASVNPIDTYVREGSVEPTGGLPHVGGADAAGVVSAVGDGVAGVEPGDRVFATGLGLFEPGSYAERVAVPASRLAPLPDAVGFDEGAAAAMAFATAWRALSTRGGLSIGDACLVHGGEGGVGHAAVQIAAGAGATVVASASTDGDANADGDGDGAGTDDATTFLRGLGADAVVDYRDDDLAESVRSALDGREVDVVLESHAAANLDADLDALARGGRVVVIGEEGTVELSPSTAMTAKVADADVRFMSIVASTADQAPILTRVGEALAAGELSVEIDATYPLAELPAAQRHATSDGVRGKVVVRVR